MQDRPGAADLLEAVQEFLIKECLPALDKQGEEALSYKALVSWNMLGVVAREFKNGEALLDEEIVRMQKALGGSANSSNSAVSSYGDKLELAGKLNRALAEKIRADGIADPRSDVWKVVKATVTEKLKIANPRFTLD